MPVYNGAEFLQRALDSLLSQTEGNFELLISDNASTDGTEAICREYLKRDQRVRYVRHDRNRGAYFNWNFVARAATGTYFKWASGNDYCAPIMLARCVEFLESDPGTVLCHGRTCIVDDTNTEQGLYNDDIELMDSLPRDRFRRVCRELSLNNAQCGVIRVSALRRTRYDRPYPAGDRVLMAELALRGKFRLLPEVMLYRRVSPKSATSHLSSADMLRFLDPNAKIDARTWIQHADYFGAIARADIPLAEKLACARAAARHAYWAKSALRRELFGMFRGLKPQAR